MTLDEAIEVMKTIHAYYPDKYHLTRRKVRMIVPLLEQMDYDGVMKKLMDFYIAAPYPPALSESLSSLLKWILM